MNWIGDFSLEKKEVWVDDFNAIGSRVFSLLLLRLICIQMLKNDQYKFNLVNFYFFLLILS
jgi:hypothetical protein